MTTLDLTAHTTVRDLDRPALVERSGLHAVGPARATTSRNEPEGVVPVNESNDPATALSAHDAAHPDGEPAAPVAAPSRPQAAARPSGWTGSRIAALVIGVLLALVSAGLLGGGGTVLWADTTQRDAAGYLTTSAHEFATAGSALASERIDLGSAGTGWLYTPALLGTVRIRVTPTHPSPALFVAIGPTADVERYLTGVSHTLISDLWTNRVQAIGGGMPRSAPGMQTFWAASTTGPGPQVLRWDPANGSWMVVVMNASGQPGIHVRADLGATYPSLLPIAVGLLATGAVFGAGAALLIVGAIRRRASRASTM